MLTNLMFATVYVTDQDRALGFYVDGLGLQKRFDAPGPDGRFLTVGFPDSPVHILLWSHPASAGQPGDDEGRIAAPGPLILESDDLHKDFADMRQRGVVFEQPKPEDYPFGIRVEALDPDGNRISLREPRKR
ncbi:VOC family protein [Streptomyces sp. NBRC 109706]|uniref:VOC family protein n=1 Tax=Streptomyces sp. NBRC 109706 TaxID=1550035 RepID=UPI0007840EF9|nr:VOC family protein [Streptomyces sp. NBRC 109706]